MRNMFIDLDGTLIDCRSRLYNLFVYLTGIQDISFDKYWRLKNQGITLKRLVIKFLRCDEQRWTEFQNEWLALIESEKFLSFDIPYADSYETLSVLYNMFNLYIVTARQNTQAATTQISKLNWTHLIKEVLVTESAITKDVLIRNKINNISCSDYFIGDTAEDILAGHNLGINCIAIARCHTDLETIIKSKPHKIFNTLRAFKDDCYKV